MKTVVATVLVLVLLCMGGLPVAAQTVEQLYEEQLQASGGRELLAALPEETRHLLDKLGIDTLEMTSFTQWDTRTALRELLSLFTSLLRGPLSSAAVVLVIVVLCAWVEGMRETLRVEEASTVFSTVCALAACGCVMVPIADCIGNVRDAMTSTSVFMGSFVPVYAGVLITGGKAATALSFQSIVLYAAELLSWVAGQVVVPLMTVSLALGLTGSVTPQIKLGGVGKWLGKAAAWILTLGMILFSGLLSLQSLAGGAADTLGTRAVKFSISSFVPVVGGSLSEAFTTIQGCLGVLRSTLGCFGASATALIVLPPLITCVCWCGVLSVCRTAAELFELQALTALLDTARDTVKCLVGVLLSSGSFLIVALTVVSTAAGGL